MPRRPAPRDTDWPQIARLYDELARMVPTPVVELNRAVAIGMADGPAAGLALVDELAALGELAGYHLLPRPGRTSFAGWAAGPRQPPATGRLSLAAPTPSAATLSGGWRRPGTRRIPHLAACP